MAQQCLSAVFVRLRLQIWAQRRFFVGGGRNHVSGLHLIGQSWREPQLWMFFCFFFCLLFGFFLAAAKAQRRGRGPGLCLSY